MYLVAMATKKQTIEHIKNEYIVYIDGSRSIYSKFLDQIQFLYSLPGCYDSNHTNEGKVKQKRSHVVRDGDNNRICTKSNMSPTNIALHYTLWLPI